MQEKNEVKPEDVEWVVVTPGQPNCNHRWAHDVSFVHGGRIRRCDRKLCREVQKPKGQE